LVCFALSLIHCRSEESEFARLIASAEAHRDAGELEAAVIDLRSALALRPRDAELNLALAEDLERAGDERDAAFFYAEARRIDGTLIAAGTGEIRLLLARDPDRAWHIARELIESFPNESEIRVQAAAVALARGDISAARYHALTSIELAPRRPEPHLLLSRVLEARAEKTGPESLVEALKETDRAVELGATPEEVLGLRARLLAALPARSDEAPAVYLEALRALRNAKLPFYGVAEEALTLARAREDTGFELAILREQVSTGDASLAAWRELARVTAERGEDADAVWVQLLETRPDAVEAQLGYVEYLRSSDRDDLAIRHLRALAHRDEQPELLLALYFLELDARPDGGAEPLDTLRSRFPDHPARFHAEGRLSLAVGRLDDATRALRRAAELAPSTTVFRDLARAELGASNATAAALAAQQGLEIAAPMSAQQRALRLLRIDAAVALGDWPEVIAQLAAIERQGARLAPIERVRLARAHYEVGGFGAGRALLDEILSEPAPPPEAYALFFVRHGEEEPQRARYLLRSALERTPSPLITGLLVRAEIAGGDMAAARELLDQGLERSGSAALFLLRANLRATDGDREGAAADADSAFRLDARYPGVTEALLATHLRAERSAAALAVVDERATQRSLDAAGLAAACRGFLHAGRLARAEELCEEALAADANNPSALRDLAFLLARHDAPLDRALRLAQEALAARGDDPEAGAALGYVYWRKGLIQPAVSMLRRGAGASRASEEGHPGLELPPVHSPALIDLYLSYALEDRGETAEAKTARRRALAADPEVERRARVIGAELPTSP
jgi:tetratricopeptide (TPR) repeat protein